MKIFKLLFAFLLVSGAAIAQNADSAMIRKIYDIALGDGHAYKNLEFLCKQIGPRLSGSEGARKSVDWTKKLMQDYGFDKVYVQEVMVPHWERGAKETAFIVEGKTKTAVPVAALGGSIATSSKGLQAEVLEVHSFDELKELGEEKVKGKIIFFNRPFNASLFDTFQAYGGAVNQRSLGAVEASKLGAVGVIVRSMTSVIDDNPHTGGLRYEEGVTQIPAAAISTRGAELLSVMIKKGKRPIQFYLQQNCRTLPDALSHNVIGEIKGSNRPETIITVGGHLDSWDLAEGAHDDGTGCMQSIEVLRIFKALGIKPNNTIRAVMFMNEENGLRGGTKYAELAKANKEVHVAAIESDAGGFTPRGFSVEDAPQSVSFFSKWEPLLKPYKVGEFLSGGSGADIGPLKRAVPGVVLIGYEPDSQRYFDVHHASNDVFENVNRRELELGAASMASLVYLIDKYGTAGVN